MSDPSTPSITDLLQQEIEAAKAANPQGSAPAVQQPSLSDQIASQIEAAKSGVNTTKPYDPGEIMAAAPYGATNAAVHGMTLGLEEPTRAALLAGTRYLTGQTPDFQYSQAAQEMQRGRQAYEAQHPWANFSANMAGGFAGPLTAAGNAIRSVASPLGQAVTSGLIGAGLGGVQGAAENSASPEAALQGAESGARTGGTLGFGIPAAASAGRALVPGLSADAQALRAAGVEPPPGAAVGGIPGYMENFVSKVPFVGAPVNAARQSSINQLTRAQGENADNFIRGGINRVLSSIGEILNPSTELGNPAIAEMRQKISDAYNKAIPTAGGVFDQQANQDIISAINNAKFDMPPDRAAQFENFVTNKVLGRVQNGVMPGQAFKDAEEQLGKEAHTYLGRAVTDPDQRKLGHAYEDLQTTLRDWLGRVTPQNAADIQNANAAYRLYKIVNNAAVRDPFGKFDPSDLLAASKRYSSEATYGAGNAPLQRYAQNQMLNDQALAQAGKNVLTPPREGGHGQSGVGLSVLGANMAEKFLENQTLPAMLGTALGYGALGGLYSNPSRGIVNSILGARYPSVAPLAPAAVAAAPMVPGVVSSMFAPQQPTMFGQ